MGERTSTYRKRDLRTAIQVAAETGLKIARIEIGKDGNIILITGDGSPAETVAIETTDFDKWKANNADPA